MNSIFGSIYGKSLSKPLCRGLKWTLPIKWVRPEKIPSIMPEKSGDLSNLPKVNPNETIAKYAVSEELKNSDEIVKSLFSFGNNRRKYFTEMHKENLISEVQRHSLDRSSHEVKLAKMTATIRNLQQVMIQYPRNKRMKVLLKEKIDKRKKFLKYLRRWDYKRFEWILEKLDLIYKPPPPEFHWITRKDSLRKIANTYCEKIRDERLNEYKNLLQSQQVDFLERKLKNLEFIRREQKECEIEVNVSESDINNVKKQLDALKLSRETAKSDCI